MGKHKYRNGGLLPLNKRMSPEQLQARAAKTEVRARMSRENAITRGIAMAALNNSTYLKKWGIRALVLIGSALAAALGYAVERGL